MFNKIIGDKPSERNIFLIYLLGFLVNLSIWIYIFTQIKPQENPIPLHYNIYFGIDLIGSWYNIYLMPLSGLIILILNYLLARALLDKGILLKYMLSISAALCQIIVLLASIFLLLQID
ncbi:hypothetical protein KKI23_02100 [Patescibacteria group bacterium]|nr:hypothetical protein [Patescibacteria group bacterium]